MIGYDFTVIKNYILESILLHLNPMSHSNLSFHDERLLESVKRLTSYASYSQHQHWVEHLLLLVLQGRTARLGSSLRYLAVLLFGFGERGFIPCQLRDSEYCE